jgi:hypothetical protein
VNSHNIPSSVLPGAGIIINYKTTPLNCNELSQEVQAIDREVIGANSLLN